MLKELTRHSYKKQNKADEVEAVEPLPDFTTPALDLSSADALAAKRGLKPMSSLSRAERFAESLPSARRTFALQIIQQYATDWVTQVRARGSSGSQSQGLRRHRSFVAASAAEGLRRTAVTFPAEQPGGTTVSRPTKKALRAMNEESDPSAGAADAIGGGSHPSGSLAVHCHSDLCSTKADYTPSHAQAPVTGQSYSQHRRKLEDSLTKEVRETTPSERQAIKGAIKAQREAAEAKAHAAMRAVGPSPRSGGATGSPLRAGRVAARKGEGRRGGAAGVIDKFMC